MGSWTAEAESISWFMQAGLFNRSHTERHPIQSHNTTVVRTLETVAALDRVDGTKD